MADDESSELSSVSSLSSAPSEDDGEVQLKRERGILKFFHKLPKGTKPAVEPERTPSPPPRKRSPSPPHDYVLADNPDIAVRWLVVVAWKNANCRVVPVLPYSSAYCSSP